MIDGNKSTVRPADFTTRILQAFKGLLFGVSIVATSMRQAYWRGHFVDQVSVCNKSV